MRKYITGMIVLLLLAGCAVRKEGYGPPPPDGLDYYNDRPGYYYYYPYADVYYDLGADRYFYLMNGNWLYSGSLPAYYYDRLGRYFRVYVPDGYPYYHVREHSRRYTRPRPRDGEARPQPESENRPRPRDDTRPGERPESRPQNRPESRPRQNDSGERPRSNDNPNNNNRPRPR